MIGIRLEPGGALVLQRQSSISGSTLLGTSATGAIQLNAEHFVELEILAISDTVGAMTLCVDGTPVITLTNVDNRNGTPTALDSILIGFRTDTGTGPTVSFDDLNVIDSATRLGDQRVEALYANADVAQGFDRSSGSSNYSLIDDPLFNGDIDYVQGSSVGLVDTYDFGGLSSSPSSIAAVQLTALALKTDAGPRSIALQAKSGATTSDGANFALLASYSKFDRIMDTDPNTGLAWLASAVNALRGGPKITA